MDVRLEELTPAGRGAVSVIRVRGKDAERLVRELEGPELAPGSARFTRLRLAGEELDEAIVCRLPDGGLELHLHGSPVLLARLASFVRAGLEPERSLDLESLAAAQLARAPAESAARILLDQAEGALGRELRSLVVEGTAEREERLGALLDRWRVARRAFRPAEVVLAGAVNSGKSTLFNALLGEGRAIVDPAAGTTRDVLRERGLLGGWPVWLVDTAGERELAADEVEREGQARGERARLGADLVLWLVPAGSPEARPPPGPTTVVVRTFADRAARTSSDADDAISALCDPEAARARVASLYRRAFALPEDPWSPGAGVPFTEPLARAIGELRGAAGPELERRVAAILELSFAPPASPS